VNGAPIPRDSALVSAGAELVVTPRWSLGGRFDGELADGSRPTPAPAGCGIRGERKKDKLAAIRRRRILRSPPPSGEPNSPYGVVVLSSPAS
jgi:hypothetical protein